jgi:thiol:disulfide interchange protein/DsbC/DsbD-like thiol-disulfide interchange protein
MSVKLAGHWMMRRLICLALATTCIASLGNVAAAQTQGVGHVAVSLVAETRGVIPGQPFRLALRQQIEPGWHTYWSNPGDSGLPTVIDWMLPPDFKTGPIVWPTPERFAVGPVVDYGYQHDILLPVAIDVPANLQLGSNITISAHASWLVCSDTCIPEDAAVNLTVPVVSIAEPDPTWAKEFAAARGRTPAPNPFPTSANLEDDKLVLHVATGDATRLRDVMFFPADSNVIDNDAPQSVNVDSTGLALTLLRDLSKPAPAALNGVLSFRDVAAADGISGAIAISTPVRSAVGEGVAGLGFFGVLLLALAGGIVLNLMPCVLPVLAIKAFGLVEHAHASARVVRFQGIAYTVGVLVSFAVIGAVLITLRSAGAEIGWGFQLQSPLFVAAMIYVLFAVGLNLSGVFTVGERMGGLGLGLAARESYAGSFWTGALATLVATPCTAPFMAAAIGYAITQPWYKSLAIFEAVGLGLAFPYAAIAFAPGLRRFLPKPGMWMLRLKQILAFPVYGTAVWLTYVLSLEAGALAATAALAGLVLIAFAAWIHESTRSAESRWHGWARSFSALAVVSACCLFIVPGVQEPTSSSHAGVQTGPDWQPFSQALVDQLRADGRPIFIDFTAAWCITCQVNERVALSNPAVRMAFAEEEVATLRADWTRQDASITRILEANGRAGVPMYLVYPKPGKTGESRMPIILPQILTSETILHEIREP